MKYLIKLLLSQVVVSLPAFKYGYIVGNEKWNEYHPENVQELRGEAFCELKGFKTCSYQDQLTQVVMNFKNCNKLTAEIKHQTSQEIEREGCKEVIVELDGKPTNITGYRGENTNRATGFTIVTESDKEFSVGVVKGALVQ
jgi:hypothetical protein